MSIRSDHTVLRWLNYIIPLRCSLGGWIHLSARAPFIMTSQAWSPLYAYAKRAFHSWHVNLDGELRNIHSTLRSYQISFFFALSFHLFRPGGGILNGDRTILSNASNLVELSAACLKNSFLYIKATSLTCRFLIKPRRRQSTNSLILIKERFLVLLVRVISNRSIKG